MGIKMRKGLLSFPRGQDPLAGNHLHRLKLFFVSSAAHFCASMRAYFLSEFVSVHFIHPLNLTPFANVFGSSSMSRSLGIDNPGQMTWRGISAPLKKTSAKKRDFRHISLALHSRTVALFPCALSPSSDRERFELRETAADRSSWSVIILNPGNNQIAAFDLDHLSFPDHGRHISRQNPTLKLSQQV
jgi:hypothetical protein